MPKNTTAVLNKSKPPLLSFYKDNAMFIKRGFRREPPCQGHISN